MLIYFQRIDSLKEQYLQLHNRIDRVSFLTQLISHQSNVIQCSVLLFWVILVNLTYLCLLWIVQQVEVVSIVSEQPVISVDDPKTAMKSASSSQSQYMKFFRPLNTFVCSWFQWFVLLFRIYLN